MKLTFRHIILLLSIIIFGNACKQTGANQHTKIRGKIVNPKTGKIFISKDFLLLQSDTLKLIAENEIRGNVNVPKEGLYVLFVFPEFQTLYLKPGDSLAFHLNVDEFDESLSFSGGLAFENNLLMDIFLENEKESNYFYRHKFNFNLQSFLKKLDSFDLIKKQLIESYPDEYVSTTDKYKAILKLSNQSMPMNLREAYARKHKDLKLPDDYFSYCNILKKPLPDPNVIYLYAFAESFLSRKISGENLSKEGLYLEIAHTINKNFYDKGFKDNVLVNYCNRYIRQTHVKQPDTVVNTFFNFMKNDIYKSYCRELIQKNNTLQEGHSFPSLILTNAHKQKILLDTILDNHKTFLSFWDLKQRKNFVSNFKKIKVYKSKYPDMNFIIINTNPDNTDEWLMQIPKEKDILFLQFSDEQSISKTLPHHLSQIYLLDGKSIKSSMINIYKPDFEQKLAAFYNYK